MRVERGLASVVSSMTRRALLVLALVACREQSTPSAGTGDDFAAEALGPHPQVDVPVLATAQGTLEPPVGTAIVLTGAPGEVEAQRAALPEFGPTLLAIGRDVEFKAAARSIDDLYRLGRTDLAILVRAAGKRRVVVIEHFRALVNTGEALTFAKIEVGETIQLGGQATTLESLTAAIARQRPSMIVIVPEPTATVQRLVEVIAAVGGRAYVGAGILPHVERP